MFDLTTFELVNWVMIPVGALMLTLGVADFVPPLRRWLRRVK
jgi:hypothetical protein